MKPYTQLTPAERAAEYAHDQGKQAVVAGGPVEGGGGGVAKGGEYRHQDHSHQAAGEAHVVKVHAVLDLEGVGRQGGEEEADEHAQ